MFLSRNNLLASVALAAMVGVGVASSASALPTAQLVSQAPAPTEETQESVLPEGLTEVKATVIRVTNDNAVRVKMEDGSYEMISLVRSTRLNSLHRGDEIFITLRGNDVVGVSSEAGAYQQVATTRRSSAVQSSQSSESVQTETRVQPQPRPQPQVVQQPAPAPAPAPAPEPAARPQEPVRALW
jgi:hypothetical protein